MIMNDNLQELLNIQAIQISIPNFILNLFIVAVLTFILSKVYINFGNSLSNRQAFAKNFIILEIKYNNDLDNNINRITSLFKFRLTKSSKFVSGINLFYN